MSRKDGSRLAGALIARKGEAAPISLSKSASKPKAYSIADESASRPELARESAGAGTVSVTVRLDPERYIRLKTLGAQTRRKNQDIFVEALDMFFDKMD